jgi:hypothetical protein
MQKKFILFLILVLSSLIALSQELPLYTCGIVNVYDAAGNRTKRMYFCNNGAEPYPVKAKEEIAEGSVEYQQVDALYPNPTTGRFSVTFSKALNNATILLTDLNGKVMQRFRANGHKVDFDISNVAAGVYFIRINDNGNAITKKVLKQ